MTLTATLISRSLLLLSVLTACTTGESASRSNVDEDVRYVIDQDNGKPIEGAIVVVTWNANVGPQRAQTCNRLESYVSGPDGSFRTPKDPKRGAVFLGAYKRGFHRGQSPKGVQSFADGTQRKWRVAHYQWNAANNRAAIVEIEPTVYTTEESALTASRERTDVFIRRSTSEVSARLQELRRLQVEASCGGVTLSSAGALPFYNAILQEQLEIGASDQDLESTRQYIRMVIPPK